MCWPLELLSLLQLWLYTCWLCLRLYKASVTLLSKLLGWLLHKTIACVLLEMLSMLQYWLHAPLLCL